MGDRTMKVTFVLPLLAFSGGIKVIFEYANKLQQRGHQVHIIAPIIPASWWMYIRRQGLKETIIKYFKGSKAIHSLNKSRVKIIKIPILNPFLFGIFVPDSDIIIATSWETAYFVNALPKWKGEKFYFIQGYEIWDVWENAQCWEKARKLERDSSKLPIIMSYVVPDDPNLVKLKNLVDASYTLPLKKITISSWLKELLEKRFNQNVYGIITNGVDFNEFYCEDDTKWNNNNSKKIILTILQSGSMLKGSLDAIKAINIVKREYKGADIEIHAFGWKGDINLSDYITFHGARYGNELRQLYCKAHIFVSSSWVEGSQLPPMEAMACKCAVVATNVGGVPDYTIPNKTAIVVPPQSPQKIAEGVIYLLENWEEAKRIAEEGHNYIRQFTWDKVIEKFERILYDVRTQ